MRDWSKLIGRRVRVYKTGKITYVGVLDHIDQDGDLILIESGQRRGAHPYQCRLLREKAEPRKAREWWLVREIPSGDFRVFQHKPLLRDIYSEPIFVREVLE